MAKMKLGNILNDHETVSSPEIFSETFELETSTSTSAVFRDLELAGSVVFEGKKLAYDGDEFTGGRISKVSLLNSEGEVYLIVTGGFKASKLWNEDYSNKVERLYDVTLEGDDVVKGGPNDDYVRGHTGKDKLYGGLGSDWISGYTGGDQFTGGGGSDYFIFAEGEGKDVIKDFDARGGGEEQDYLVFFGIDDYTKERDRKDTIIHYGDHDSIRLVDVRPNQITAADFSDLQ